METEDRHTGDFESEIEVGIVIFCAADEMLLFLHQAHAYEMQHLCDTFIQSSNLGGNSTSNIMVQVNLYQDNIHDSFFCQKLIDKLI